MFLQYNTRGSMTQETPPLNLPPYPFRLKRNQGVLYIFDEIRKKWLVNTPEEWVRQHFIMFLNKEYNYPLSLIAIEQGLKVNGMPRRTDILTYSTHGNPILLVECKAPKIKLNQAVFEQIARYNIPLQVQFLAVTNGIQHYFCEIDIKNKSWKFIQDIPVFS